MWYEWDLDKLEGTSYSHCPMVVFRIEESGRPGFVYLIDENNKLLPLNIGSVTGGNNLWKKDNTICYLKKSHKVFNDKLDELLK